MAGCISGRASAASKLEGAANAYRRTKQLVRQQVPMEWWLMKGIRLPSRLGGPTGSAKLGLVLV